MKRLLEVNAVIHPEPKSTIFPRLLVRRINEAFQLTCVGRLQFNLNSYSFPVSLLLLLFPKIKQKAIKKHKRHKEKNVCSD